MNRKPSIPVVDHDRLYIPGEGKMCVHKYYPEQLKKQRKEAQAQQQQAEAEAQAQQQPQEGQEQAPEQQAEEDEE